MKKYLFSLMSIVSLLAMIGCGNPGNDGNEATPPTEDVDKPTLTLAWAPSEANTFTNGIIQHVAEQYGYSVEITEGDVGVLFLGVSQGEIDIYPDVWTPTVHSTYIERYEDDLEIIGMLYENTPLGWAVPSYVEIDSIEDLKGREDEFQGRVVGIEPSAGMMSISEEIIEGYELDYELISGSTIGMLSQLQRSITNEEPMVFLAWRPHIMFQQFDIKLLEDPQGYWQYDNVRIAVPNGFQEKSPELYHFLENFNLEIDEIEEAMLNLEEGQDVEQVVNDWVEENQEDLDQWLEQ